MSETPWELHPLDFRFALHRLDDEFATYGEDGYGYVRISREHFDSQGRPVEVFVRLDPGTWPPP
jgi:hypothetical protein